LRTWPRSRLQSDRHDLDLVEDVVDFVVSRHRCAPRFDRAERERVRLNFSLAESRFAIDPKRPGPVSARLLRLGRDGGSSAGGFALDRRAGVTTAVLEDRI
jgi:hypothetical protein